MDLSKDIRSLSDFKRNTGELVERMEDSGEPMVLTVNGKAKLVVQEAAAYQKLLDSLEEAETVRGVRCGLDDLAAGRTQPVREAMEEMRRNRRTPTKGKR